jgi:hypothetical protein
MLTVAVLVVVTAWPSAAQARRHIDWWKVAGIALCAIGGGFLVVGLGHQIAGRLASGELLADDTAGRLSTGQRHEAERHIRSLDNGALLGYGVGAGLALAGTLVLLLRPVRSAPAPPAPMALSPSPASGLLAPRLVLGQNFGSWRLKPSSQRAALGLRAPSEE